MYEQPMMMVSTPTATPSPTTAVSLAGLAGGAFALTKVDPGFVEVFNTTVIKDSNIQGAGYEAVLKNGAIPARGAAKKGTTKIGTGLFGKKK